MVKSAAEKRETELLTINLEDGIIVRIKKE